MPRRRGTPDRKGRRKLLPQLWFGRGERTHPALQATALGERRYHLGRRPRRLPRTSLRTRLRALPWWGMAFAVVVVAFSAGATFGAYSLLSGETLRVRHADVAGIEIADPHAVVAAADLGGRSLLVVDTDAAARRIVATLPEVKAAAVERDWPQGVRIAVTEHHGWGYWESAGQRAVIDADGLVIEHGRPPAADAVTIIDVTGTLPPQAGDVIDADTVQTVARLVADARSQRLGVQVGRFEFHSDRGLVIRVTDGPDAVFGDSHNYDFKIAAWGALLNQLDEEERDIQEIDLRFGRHLVMR